MANVQVDVSSMREFFEKLGRAASGDFKRDLETWLDAVGFKFIEVIEERIIKLQVIDTRQLLNSFQKGDAKNVWKIEDGGMTLEIGSAVEYAQWVNDGHWTNGAGVRVRFVPGYWSGDRFEHKEGAKGGMVLRQQWVEGRHYFDGAIRLMNNLMPELLDNKLQEWLEKYFA